MMIMHEKHSEANGYIMHYYLNSDSRRKKFRKNRQKA